MNRWRELLGGRGRLRGERVRTVAARGTVELGAAVPAALVNVLWALVAAVTAFAALGGSAWLIVALILVVLGAWLPRMLFPWLFLALIGLSMLWGDPREYTPALLITVAGAHLAWVLAGVTSSIPAAARIRLRALGRPLLRFALVQAGVQAAALLVLVVVPHSAVRVAGPIGAAALIGLAVALVIPLTRRR